MGDIRKTVNVTMRMMIAAVRSFLEYAFCTRKDAGSVCTDERRYHLHKIGQGKENIGIISRTAEVAGLHWAADK